MEGDRSTAQLSSLEDWHEYHGKAIMGLRRIPDYVKLVLEKEIWSERPGKVFELGCGASTPRRKYSFI